VPEASRRLHGATWATLERKVSRKNGQKLRK